MIRLLILILFILSLVSGCGSDDGNLTQDGNKSNEKDSDSGSGGKKEKANKDKKKEKDGDSGSDDKD